MLAMHAVPCIHERPLLTAAWEPTKFSTPTNGPLPLWLVDVSVERTSRGRRELRSRRLRRSLSTCRAPPCLGAGLVAYAWPRPRRVKQASCLL